MIRYLHTCRHIEHWAIFEQILQKLMKAINLNKMLSSVIYHTFYLQEFMLICKSIP